MTKQSETQLQKHFTIHQGGQRYETMYLQERQECQWSGQKLYGSAECVWLSLKFTHYQIFYQPQFTIQVQHPDD